MLEARLIVDGVETPEDVSDAAKSIKALNHALTSEKEATALLKAKLAALGIVWNKQAKQYEFKQ